MSEVAILKALEPPQAVNPAPEVPNGKFGIWLFLSSEVMFFTGLIGAYIVLRAAHPDWSPLTFTPETRGTADPEPILAIPITAFNTFLLICSSVTMVFALQAAKQRNHAKMLKFLWTTIGIGSVFLGIQAYEYNELIHHGFKASTSIFGSCFYTMTGFHGMHVLGGVIWMTVIALGATFQGRCSKGDSYPLEYVGLYWHFVDLVWILLFTIVYLM